MHLTQPKILLVFLSTRLDAVAEDAELTEKSSGQLKEMGDLLKRLCEETVKEYEEKLLQDEQFDGMFNFHFCVLK